MQRLSVPVRDLVIQAARGVPEQAVRDLFEYYLPFEQRAKRLGTEVDPDEILALTGDAARGRELFLSGTGLQCRSCHHVGSDTAGISPALLAGPDLARLEPPRDRRQLLESILEPSKRIEAAYRAVMVQTSTGRVLVGVIHKETPEQLVLLDAQNQKLQIDTDEIEVVVSPQKSLMPELLTRDLTAQQLADLLAYLASRQHNKQQP